MRRKTDRTTVQETKPVEIYNNRTYRLFVLVVIMALMIIIWTNRESLLTLSKLGLFGIFAINFISYSTVFFPIPGVASVFLGGALWNPVLVGIFSGLGASIGELFSYFIGYGGRGLVNYHNGREPWMVAVKKWIKKAAFPTIAFCAFLPLPFDFVGILAGAMNYPILKFLAATLIGRILRDVLVAWTGARIL